MVAEIALALKTLFGRVFGRESGSFLAWGCSTKLDSPGTNSKSFGIGLVILCLVIQPASPAQEELAAKGKNTVQIDNPKSRVDRYGDPLPEGAVSRLGSIRFRHAGLSDFIFLDGGRTVLSLGLDGMLRFWDVATGRPLRTVKLQGGIETRPMLRLALSSKFVAATQETTATIWDVESGKKLKTLDLPQGQVGRLCFSPDGQTLALSFWNFRVIVWEWKTGKEVQVSLPSRKIPNDICFHAGFSPNGNWFAVGGGLGEALCVFEVGTWREVHRLRCDAGASAFSHDGKRLAISSILNDKGGREAVVRLFDVETGKELSQFPQRFHGCFFSLAFSADDTALACTSFIRSCILASATGRVLHTLPGRLNAVAFAPGGEILATATENRLRWWDVGTGKERDDRPGNFGFAPLIGVSPDGQVIASADRTDRFINIWDVGRARLSRQIPLKDNVADVVSLEFSGDGKSLIDGQSTGLCQFWDIASGKEVSATKLDRGKQEGGSDRTLRHLHVSPNGKRLDTLESRRGYAYIASWSLPSGKFERETCVADDWGGVRALAPDGKTIALMVSNDVLTIVDVKTGATRFRISGVKPGPKPQYSGDGRLLLARLGGTDSVSIDQSAGGITFVYKPATGVGGWETATGRKVGGVDFDGADQHCLSHDNRFLVANNQEYLSVFDLATGKETRRYRLPQSGRDGWDRTFVYALSFLPDSTRVFTALGDGTGLIWDLASALKPTTTLVKSLNREDVVALWNDLANDDAGRAYRAIWALGEHPSSVAFLETMLDATGARNRKDLARVATLIQDLDNPDFKTREKATTDLESFGRMAEESLRQALANQPSLEMRRRLEKLLARVEVKPLTPDLIRTIRAVQVLEHIATAEARRVLEDLAKTEPKAYLAPEAQEALARLAQRVDPSRENPMK